jgi:ribosome-associated protein
MIIEIATLARRIVELVEDKQAHDIVLLDIRTLTTIADYFIICSADNDRQIRAIVEHVDEVITREFQRDPRIEGAPATGWVVLDYQDIIIHIFHIDQRDFYRLEELWSSATPVVVIQ